MDKIININEIEIKKIITNVQNNIGTSNININTFIYGDNGVGKTTIIKKILNDLEYNIHEYNIFSSKNKNVTEFYDEYNKQNRNIMDIFYNKANKGIILIDNIDLINSVDKNTISSLIKILRPKKNKKNLNDNNINTQIIIIGSNDSDKKIKELLKICNTYKINSPSYKELYNIIQNKHPTISYNTINDFLNINKNLNYYLIDKFEGLVKSKSIDKFIKFSTDNLTNNNVKYINYCILKNRLHFNDDNNKINDTDKTTVSLLFHENIIDYITNDKAIGINVYKKILQNYCFGDYMDRIIFQKQLWQLNEISFKIKVIYNNYLFHNYIEKYREKNNVKANNIRFTKILTKYSSEFNNYTFLINMCQSIDIDKKDLLILVYNIKNNFTQENINYLINKYNISILDINRLIKFISVINEYQL